MDYVYNGSIKIPIVYYLIAVIIGMLMGVCFYCRGRSGRKSLCAAFIVAYAFLILSTTVLARPAKLDYQYKLTPFWSYSAIVNGRTDLIAENISNILMLMPVGLLLPIIIKMNAGKVIAVGSLFSLGIELLQLILKRGLFEFDDIIHNTIGCLIGYVIYCLVSRAVCNIRIFTVRFKE